MCFIIYFVVISACCWLNYGKEMDGVYLHLLPFPALLLYGAQETSVLITFDSEVNVVI